MSRYDLEYVDCKVITHQVEALLLDVSFPGIDGAHIATADICDGFLNYLANSGLTEYWKNNFEISPVYTSGCYSFNYANYGAKYIFTRLVSKTRDKSTETMGNGTQWTSDVVNLMKDFVAYERKLDKENDTSNYQDARLIFRLEGKQFEWK